MEETLKTIENKEFFKIMEEKFATANAKAKYTYKGISIEVINEYQ